MGITLKLGEHYLEQLDVDMMFRTPGMRFHTKELEQAREKGIVVTSEMEVFLTFVLVLFMQLRAVTEKLQPQQLFQNF